MAPAKGLLNDSAAAGAGAPAPAPGGTPAPELGAHPGANEGARFQNQGVQRPDFVPEKFWKDGKVDIENTFKSYGELETRFGTKTEELLKQLDGERRKGLPEAADKYELTIAAEAGLSVDDVKDHPAFDWWRNVAFDVGIPQEKFTEGVGQLIGILTQGPDLEAEAKKLGENATQRITAVSTWAKSTFTDADEFAAIQMLGTSAAGVKVLEKLMGKAPTSFGSEGSPAAPGITPEKLKSMQADARYWSPVHRDVAFVKEVDDGFAALYGAK